MAVNFIWAMPKEFSTFALDLAGSSLPPKKQVNESRLHRRRRDG
jgi:hypothetical protein